MYITNGNFESENLSGWTTTGNVFMGSIAPGLPPHSGLYNASMKTVDNINPTLIQKNIPTIKNTRYQLNFYASFGGPDNMLLVTINNETTSITSVGSPYAYSEYSVNFISGAEPTTIQFDVRTIDKTVFLIDDISIIQLPMFYSGKSLIKCRNIKTNEISNVHAHNITAEHHEVYSVNNKKFIKVIHIIIAGPVQHFLLIDQDSIDIDKPFEKFYISLDHYTGAKHIKVDPELIYSICTENREQIIINGLEILSFSLTDWQTYTSNKSIDWNNNIDA